MEEKSFWRRVIEDSRTYFFFVVFVILLVLVIIAGLRLDVFDKWKKVTDGDPTCETDQDCNNNGECWCGKCLCFEGWTGTHCNKSLQFCLSLNETELFCFDDECCNDHGFCHVGKCLCEGGWFGKHCQFNSCPEVSSPNCSVHDDCNYDEKTVGECYYRKCFCTNPNYVGPTCNLERRDLSFCISDAQCLHGGKCFPNNHGNGECYCPSTTTGNKCQNLIV